MNVKISVFRYLVYNPKYNGLLDQVDIREEMIPGKAAVYLPSITLLLIRFSIHKGLIFIF
jgi:hypothetical protein